MKTNQIRRDWNAQQRPVISSARRGPVAPRRSWKRLIIPLLVAVVVLPVVFAGWLWFHVDSSVRRIDAFPDYPGRPEAAAGTNWLVVGSDSREGLDPETAAGLHVGDADGQRTDTILLAHLPD
ncbi:hypothetical protein E1181_25405, partial [Saccharopolyspora terrae]